MSDAFEQQDWVKFGVAAALSRQYASDRHGFVQLLADMLRTALPDETEVKMRGGLFSKKSIERVSVTMGDNRYSIEDSGSGPLRTAKTHIVRGIALKTEEMPADDWVAEIGAALDQRAAQNASARSALGKLLG